MNPLSISLSLFEEARTCYAEKQFANARRLIEAYRKSIHYELFEHQDRRRGCSPGVSVIVVSYRAGQGLLECLESMGHQSDPDFEIILVDNGGNQDIFEQLAHHPVLHLRPPINLFPSEGRNVGAHFARSDLLVFVDDDALIDIEYVENVRNAWRIFEFSALRGRILPRKVSTRETVSGHYDMGLFPMPAVLMTEGNMAIKKEVFLAVGGFDPLVFGGEGTELTYRCLNRFPGRDIYYWPSMLIFHDFAVGGDLFAKKRRHAIASDYFNYLAPEINFLQGQYGRWYQARPGKSIVYDQRSFAKKVRAGLLGKWIALVNQLDRINRR